MLNFEDNRVLKITHTKVYGLDESIQASAFPMTLDPDNAKNSTKVVEHLAQCKPGTGHDCFLKGITVQANFTAPEYWWRQADRYTWFSYISSQSKMHRLLMMKIEDQVNQYVSEPAVAYLISQIAEYKQMKDSCATQSELSEQYQKIVSNTPMGLMLTARKTTNYLQLKTMYLQRCIHQHKLEEWKYFGEWVRSLPQSHLITGGK